MRSLGSTLLTFPALLPQPRSPEALLTEDRMARAGKHTYHHEAHLAHGLLVVIVHLADQGVAQVHGDALDRLVLPRGAEDAEQKFVHAAVLELQLLGDAEVAQGQTAVPLHLGQVGDSRARSGTDLEQGSRPGPPRAGQPRRSSLPGSFVWSFLRWRWGSHVIQAEFKLLCSQGELQRLPSLPQSPKTYYQAQLMLVGLLFVFIKVILKNHLKT